MLTLLLGFAAVNTGNNLLFLVVSGLLAFMCVTGLAGMLNLQLLFPEIIPPEEIFAKTALPVKVRLLNSKRFLPSFLVRITCSGCQSLTIPVVPAGSSTEAFLRMSFPVRGKTTIGTVTVGSIFPVNFFYRYWSFVLEDELVVFPQLVPGGSNGVGGRLRPYGSLIERQRGLDGELEGIRQYSGRESLRLVHWKLSARGNDLMVKEFASYSAVPLVIDPELFPGTAEERISRAAWLIKRFCTQRPVGLRLAGVLIPPAEGTPHSRRLLRELALHGNNRP